ncbi:MAG: PD-(D/E)XK nuclease family protein [Gemmataceae bacterium]
MAATRPGGRPRICSPRSTSACPRGPRSAHAGGRSGITVRLWGRIDRVDVAQCGDDLGFWVIDYKTGRSSHYTATEVNDFRKLQLARCTRWSRGCCWPAATPGRSAWPTGW